MNPISPLEASQQPRTVDQPLILAVDDDDDNLLLLSYALETFGCRFISRSNSQTALDVAKTYRPDLILLDILMPHVDGMEVVQHLKHDTVTCNIPVIAVTALARAEDRQTILQAGFTDYLSKPYMLEDLEALIHRYISWVCPANQA
jgi:CheY-like chemotaxis protein